ncbi:hypothetical protein THAR02_10753 [Trichoderma harzianum]|uniref:FHA domain-containing protein n=1 Tax=Trichoderma harzianum TaxID=5544 RepID=A0A0F9X8P6_TRIHA|nr:hypothetical protein THAR02_10753 [Trichoderma harzianum]
MASPYLLDGELPSEMRRSAQDSPKLISCAVLVTLTAVNPPPDFLFPTRRLLLESNQSVPLGRMSKKNNTYAATGKNGWIDSAVMSRTHASLYFDQQHKAVFLSDVGSLHGTFYNDTRLKPHQIQAIKDGDLIRFGIPVDRGSDICAPCIMEVGVEFGPQGSFQAPTVFRVPDETDEEESADEDHGDSTIRHGLQVLRDNNIRPAKNCITREVVTIDLSDHEMGSPAPEDQTASTRSIQDLVTDRAVSISEKSHSRIPSPPGTIDIPDDIPDDISDDGPVFYEDEYEEEYMSESDDDSHGESSLEDTHLDDPLHHNVLDSDQHVPHIEPTELHEAEIFDRFENHCLPPIMNFSVPNAASVSNQHLPSLQLPSLLDTFRSQEISMGQNNTTCTHTNETDTPNQSFVSVPTAPEPVENRFWPVDVAQSRATESSLLLDSGAEFLKSPLKEHLEVNIRSEEHTLDYDESSAYQFEVTKAALQQQWQKKQPIQQDESIQQDEPVQQDEPIQQDEPTQQDEPIQKDEQAQNQQQQPQAELRSVHTDTDQPMESPEKAVRNKRKAMEISEMTAEEIPFAELTPVQESSPPSARPKSADDSAMDISPVDVPSEVEEPQVKRLRKAAEIFGYAALGGVAVMSALIATAPTL